MIKNLKALANQMISKNKDSITIEINKEELELLLQGTEFMSNRLVEEMCIISEVTEMKELIQQYTSIEKVNEIINEELESLVGDLEIPNDYLDIIMVALSQIEETTAKNLKLLEGGLNYRILCKTMVTATGLIEKIEQEQNN